MNGLKKIITIVFLLLNLSVAFSQTNNLIRNGNVDEPFNVNAPFYPGLVDGWFSPDTGYIGQNIDLDIWQSRLRVKKEHILHSPDWFMNNTFNGRIKFSIRDQSLPLQPLVTPKISRGYIGMGAAELIQQKIEKKNRFEPGESYTLSFFIRPIVNSQFFDSRSSDWVNEGMDLTVRLKNTKMKYKSIANKVKNREDPDKYSAKRNINKSISILDKHISISQYPFGEWSLVTVSFVATDRKKDWIIFELESDKFAGSRSPYLLIDGFTLSKTCELPSCSKLAGRVVPNTNGFIDENNPLRIFNLNNVQEAKIRITNVLGQTTFWSQTINCTNGISTPVFFDGRDAFGNQLAAGQYIAEIEHTNECGTETARSVFNKLSNYAGPPVQFEGCYNGPIQTPVFCCSLEPNITIDHVTLSGVGRLDYRVVQNISVAPQGNVQVTSNADVDMRAGQTITLSAGLTIEPGALFNAKIESCSVLNKLRTSDVLSQSTEVYTPNLWSLLNDTNEVIIEREIEEVVQEDNSESIITCHPNPTDQYLEFSMPLSNIKVYNSAGIVRLEKEEAIKLDVEGLKPGLYFILSDQGKIKFIKE